MKNTNPALAGIVITEDDESGYIVEGTCTSPSIPTTAGYFQKGCEIIDISTGTKYRNTGTVAVPVWNDSDSIATDEIADGAVTYAKRSVVGTATATADGLTTGLILPGETFVTVTSDSATKFVTLPAITSATIGQTIDLYVGATGYELVTPASSNNTINTVDSDQTNQLDVAANTLLRCIQITATGWAAYQVAATTITVVAPDND
jgi:hypothetical protein